MFGIITLRCLEFLQLLRVSHVSAQLDLNAKSHAILAQNYTQNIDTLETVVGVQNVLQCHGSFATASCLECRIRVAGSVIEQEIMRGEVPLCKSCSHSGKVSRKATKKRSRKLDSDDDEEDDPLFPPWIMKVIIPPIPDFSVLKWHPSLTLHSLAKS
jgi:NAD-dependent SIR2 family protein deacetylase